MVSWLDFPSCLFILLSFLSYSFILWTQNSFVTEHWKQIKSTIHSVALCIPKVLFSPFPNFLSSSQASVYSHLHFFLLLLCLAYCLSLELNLCHAQFISFSLYFFPLPKVWFLHLHLISCPITFSFPSLVRLPLLPPWPSPINFNPVVFLPSSFS